MNVRPRLLVSNFVSVKMGMSKKTKPPTHYETLEVNNRATQGEIKTAYFKLSKRYHPDKNSSDVAITKFREVSEAYEILGNYNSRKSYDRSILTHTEHHVPKKSAKPEDPNIKYYQSQAALYRQNPQSGSTPLYDFDAWTKAHYGNTLRRGLKDRIEVTRIRAERGHYERTASINKDFGVALFAFMFITMLLVMRVTSSSEYDQVLTMRQKENLEFSNRSEKNSEKAAVDSVPSN